MALCCMTELLQQAKQQNRAVGAFNVGNLEMLMGAVKAAEDTNTPIILQIAECRFPNSPLHLMGPMMIAAAKQAETDIAVHLDHGLTLDAIQQALEIGFTSVMYDGSKFPIKENIANTRLVLDMAEKYGAAVEAELGILGQDEDGKSNGGACYTKPEDAERFVDEVPVDALAVSIGNAHGHYLKTPALRFDILEQIRDRIAQPLVLHGGTGISPEGFQKCIDLGIRKINIASATFDSLTEGARQYFKAEEKYNFTALNENMTEGAYSCIKRHIEIFNKECELR